MYRLHLLVLSAVLLGMQSASHSNASFLGLLVGCVGLFDGLLLWRCLVESKLNQ